MGEKEAPKKAPSEKPAYLEWVDKLTNPQLGDMQFEVKEEEKVVLAGIFEWIDDPEAGKNKNKFTPERIEKFREYINVLKSEESNMSKLEEYVANATFETIEPPVPDLHKVLVELKKYVEGTLTFPLEGVPAESKESLPVQARSGIPIDQDPEGTMPPTVLAEPKADSQPTVTAPGVKVPSESTSDDPDKVGDVAAKTDANPPTSDNAKTDGGKPADSPGEKDASGKDKGDLRSFIENLDTSQGGGGPIQDSLVKIFTTFANVMKALGNFRGLGGGAGKITPDDVKVIDAKVDNVDPNETFKAPDKSSDYVPSVEYVKRRLGLVKPDIKDAATLLNELKNYEDVFEYNEDEGKTKYSNLQVGDLVFFGKQGQKNIADTVAIVSRVDAGQPKRIFIKSVSTVTNGNVMQYDLSVYPAFKNGLYMGFLHKKTAPADTAPAKTEPVTPPAEKKTTPPNPPVPKDTSLGAPDPP